MNNLANNQLFEFCIILLASVAYCVLHFSIKGVAILWSGKRKGIIRGFLQGVLFVFVFAFAMILFDDGNIKYYHIITYVGIVFGEIKLSYFAARAISTRFHKDIAKKKGNV